MKKTFKILLVWCFFSITSTTLAFLPSRTSISIVIHRQHRPSSSSHVLGGTIGNEDFSKIFGSQEAAERRTRDLASEWQYSRPNKTNKDDGKEEISTTSTGIIGNNKNKQQKQKQQQESELNTDLEESVSRKTRPIKVGKYVPPPRLWALRKRRTWTTYELWIARMVW